MYLFNIIKYDINETKSISIRWTNNIDVISINRSAIIPHKFISSSHRTKKRSFSFFFFSFSLFFSHSQRRLRQKAEKKIARQEVARQEAATPQPCHWIRISKSLISTSPLVSPPFLPRQEKDKGNASLKAVGMGEKILAIGRVFLFFSFSTRGQVH